MNESLSSLSVIEFITSCKCKNDIQYATYLLRIHILMLEEY